MIVFTPCTTLVVVFLCLRLPSRLPFGRALPRQLRHVRPCTRTRSILRVLVALVRTSMLIQCRGNIIRVFRVALDVPNGHVASISTTGSWAQLHKHHMRRNAVCMLQHWAARSPVSGEHLHTAHFVRPCFSSQSIHALRRGSTIPVLRRLLRSLACRRKWRIMAEIGDMEKTYEKKVRTMLLMFVVAWCCQHVGAQQQCIHTEGGRCWRTRRRPGPPQTMPKRPCFL